MAPAPTAKMKSTSTMKPRQTMRGHADWVTGVAHLRDGQRIITCSNDGSLRLWNLESGVQIGNDWRDDGKEVVESIALSPNGKTVASGSRDGKVRLWDVETKKVVARWTGHTGTVTSLCWSADGEQVVSGSNDGTIRVWDVESGDTGLGPIKTGHRGFVSAVIYSPDTTKIATGGYNNTPLKIWDAKTGDLLSTIKLDDTVFSLAWTTDQKKLIFGDSDGSIRIFDTATWQQIAILEGHTNIVNSLSLFPNDRLLVSTSHDHTVRLWNLDTNLLVGLPIQHEDCIRGAAISADGKLLVTGCDDKNAYVWEIHSTLKDAGLDILEVPQDRLKQKAPTQNSLMDTNAKRRPAKWHGYTHQLPPRPSDDVRNGVQTSGAHSHSSPPRLPRSSASPPHTPFNRFPSLFHRSHNTNQSMEVQQSHPRRVEVAAVRDKQALFVAPRPERVSDRAKRIKNPTWWTRCILFICCVSIPQDASDAQDTNHPQDTNNVQHTSGHQ